MKIQLINSSKLKIIFNKIDLDENNISLHNFLSMSQTSQNFIDAILEIAYEDLGFEIENDDFTYEIFCFDFSEFIIIITKNSDIKKTSYSPQNKVYFKKYTSFRDNTTSKQPSFKFSHNKLSKNKNLFFFFNNFEDFLTFSEFFKNSINFKNVDSILYKYNDIFLLEIITSDLLENEANFILSNALEASSNSIVSGLTLTKFKEFAEVLYPQNALNL